MEERAGLLKKRENWISHSSLMAAMDLSECSVAIVPRAPAIFLFLPPCSSPFIALGSWGPSPFGPGKYLFLNIAKKKCYSVGVE